MRYPFADLIQQGPCLLLMPFEINNERAYFHSSHPRGPCAVSAAATRTPPSLCGFYDADEGNKAAFKEHTGHKSNDNAAKKLLRRTQVAWHHSSFPWQATTSGSPGILPSECFKLPRRSVVSFVATLSAQPSHGIIERWRRKNEHLVQWIDRVGGGARVGPKNSALRLKVQLQRDAHMVPHDHGDALDATGDKDPTSYPPPLGLQIIKCGLLLLCMCIHGDFGGVQSKALQHKAARFASVCHLKKIKREHTDKKAGDVEHLTWLDTITADESKTWGVNTLF